MENDTNAFCSISFFSIVGFLTAILIRILVSVSYHFGSHESDVKISNLYEKKIKKIIDDNDSEINRIVDRRTKIVFDSFIEKLKSSGQENLSIQFEDYINKFDPVGIIKEIEKYK